MAKKTIKKDMEKELEKKVEKLVEKKITEYFEQNSAFSKTTDPKTNKIFGEIIGYAFALLFLFVIFPKMPIITPEYSLYLPIAVWATTLGAVLKIFKHAIEVNTIKRIFEICELLISIYSTYWLIVIFPIDLSKIGQGQFNFFISFALYVVIFALFLAIFVNFVRIFIPNTKRK